MHQSPSPEQTRIRGHLWRAEQRARARDVSNLDRVRLLLRALLLDELRRYRREGRFPKNESFDARTPHFVDASATRCAVAHLLELTGEHALVQRIARERNHARVRELADEPRLVAWLDAVGFSLAEAAAIQPTYDRVHAACICGGSIGAGGEHTGFEPLPARGVLMGTALRIEDGLVVVRVDEGHARFTPFEVGQEVLVRPVPHDENWMFTPQADGTWVVSVPPIDPYRSQPQGGPDHPLMGARLSDEGSYSCKSGDFRVGPVTEEQLVDVLLASDCRRALGKIRKSWGEIEEDTQCAAQPGAVDGPLTPVAALLMLVATIVARRRLRPMP